MKNIILYFILLTSLAGMGQEEESEFYALFSEDSLTKAHQYEQAIQRFSKEDSLEKGDLYNLSICYSNMGDYTKARALLLEVLEDLRSEYLAGILLDYRLEKLRVSEEWDSVYKRVIELFTIHNGAVKDTALAIDLFLHGIQDQRYRGLLATQEFGDDGYLVNKPINVDSINIVFLDSLLKVIDWPTYEMVGKTPSNFAFYIMQHSDKKHLRKYIKLMKKAVDDNNANKLLWAKAFDRLRIRRGKKQIYGTQFVSYRKNGKDEPFKPYPIKNPEEVNKRRKEIGFKTTVEERLKIINGIHGYE